MIRTIIKKNQTIVSMYRKLIFYKNCLTKDAFNFKKWVLFEKVYPYTMISYERLSNVYDLSRLIEKEKKEGSFVECGVWKGGCAAVMAFIADRAKSNRKVWLFDSFEGLPEPTDKDGGLAKKYAKNKTSGKLLSINECVGPLEDVKKIFFSELKINKKNIVIKKGWFQDTLPEAKDKIGPISILRLDADWYESTKSCLDALYDKIVCGGYVVIDDYGHWEGTKKAVDEFLRERGLNPTLIKIDYTGIYFKKP
ncbi:TylF/MycF/NovP-related O-methyltransferase [Patescibacteria group bacterium]